MNALLLDLDGVLYQGERPIPGGDRVVAWLREARIPHLFVTNTTSRPRAALVEKLAGLGIPVDPESLLTPAVAAADRLAGQGKRPLALFVPEATREEFADLPLLDPAAESGAGAVVVGDLGAGWDFATLNRAFRLLMDEPRPELVALGMTRYWQAEDGLRLDAGAFVHALAYASGLEPVVLGKPAAAFFHAGVESLGADASKTAMIGDDIVGDVGGAIEAGLQGLLVRTGKFRPGDLERGIEPTAVLDSIADLPDWWRSRGD
ncbi:MAG: TIGR01458 family HAD-type hydrolase [Halofilum sp. (in: g-proteobacteria)]|nr:TIGR01458 family HAD-type hydrolase [Halofilum sp. (in: g-proteobacteria)]